MVPERHRRGRTVGGWERNSLWLRCGGSVGPGTSRSGCLSRYPVMPSRRRYPVMLFGHQRCRPVGRCRRPRNQRRRPVSRCRRPGNRSRPRNRCRRPGNRCRPKNRVRRRAVRAVWGGRAPLPGIWPRTAIISRSLPAKFRRQIGAHRAMTTRNSRQVHRDASAVLLKRLFHVKRGRRMVLRAVIRHEPGQRGASPRWEPAVFNRGQIWIGGKA